MFYPLKITNTVSYGKIPIFYEKNLTKWDVSRVLRIRLYSDSRIPVNKTQLKSKSYSWFYDSIYVNENPSRANKKVLVRKNHKSDSNQGSRDDETLRPPWTKVVQVRPAGPDSTFSRPLIFQPMKSVACPKKHDYWKSYLLNICRHMVNWTVPFKWNELTNQKLRTSTNQMSIIPKCFSILVYWSLVWLVLLLLLSLLSEEINKRTQ